MTTANTSKLLVPIDFTDVTRNAMNYAISLANLNSDNLIIVHVVKSSKDEAAALQKLKMLAESGSENLKGELEYKVFVGDVLEDMGNFASSMDASLIVMGTHGEHGLQKVFGSHALKLINHSKVPLIIVQKDTVYKEIKKIALTIDLEKESIQVVKIAASLGEKFGAEVVMIGGDHSDETLRRRVQLNMRTAMSHLQQHGVRSSSALLDRKDFEANLINYCQSNGIDMLAATYYAETFHAFSTKFVQHLLENDLQIPVITIDSMATGVSSQLSFLSI